MKNRKWVLFVAVVLLQCWLFCQETETCECSSYYFNFVSIEMALNDSLVGAQKPDSVWFGKLKDSVAASASCFIGTFEKIVLDTSVRYNTKEIVVIRKVQTIKGRAIGDTFTVVHNNVNGGDCTLQTAPLLGQKFLCVLGKDTVPKDLRSLGISAMQCVSFDGILVTKNHLVTRGDICMATCWSFLRQVSLQIFIDAVTNSVHNPIARSVAPKNGIQTEEIYSIDGKRNNLPLNKGKAGNRILIYKNRSGVITVVRPYKNNSLPQ